MNKKLAFISVNYGTSHLISNYVLSIKNLISNAQIVIVDNYFSEEERLKVIEICKLLNVEVVENINNGYGNGLEIGINFVKREFEDISFFVLSNIDLIFTKFDYKETDYACGYIPKSLNNGQYVDNVFMTKFQKLFINIHKIPFLRKNKNMFLLKILFFKLLKFIPSKAWAVHGSCFIISWNNKDIIQPIFNKNTFLYSEELEVASYMEKNGMPFISSNILIEHIGSVSTEKSFSSLSDKMDIFVESFDNWYSRWK